MKRNMKKGGVLFDTWEDVAADRDSGVECCGAMLAIEEERKQ